MMRWRTNFLFRYFSTWIAVFVLATANHSRAELIAFYDFNSAGDASKANDSSGKNNHAILEGPVYTPAGGGHTGQAGDRALDFLGASDPVYMEIPSVADGAFNTLTEHDQATIAMWLYGSEEQPADGTVAWFAGPVTQREFVIHVPWSDGVVYFDMAGCDSCLFQQEPDPTKYMGEWNHYAFVKNGENAMIYQNGELFAESTAPLNPLNDITLARFGTFGDGPPRYGYTGFMDDIGIWDEALSPEAIAVLAKGQPGDFDLNGRLDANDVDLLSAAITAGSNEAKFDLNRDNKLTVLDRDVWVRDVRKTYYGDANLNGEFNTEDFVAVFQLGEYEDTVAKNSTWSDGDWNGDREFDSGDFVTAFADGGFEIGPRASVASQVPEPAAALVMGMGLGLLLHRGRRRDRAR